MSETLTQSKWKEIIFSKWGMLTIALLWVLLDQITKGIADSQLLPGQITQVFPGFDLLLAYNSGAAFSFLSNAGGWQRWLFTGISTVVSLMVLIWLLKNDNRKNWIQGLALAFILGGAIGNLIDRAFVGEVIDFISVYYGEYRFATFNIADSAISIGAVLLVLDMIVNRHQE